MQGTAYKWLLFGQCSCSLGKTKGFVHLFLCWLFFPQRLLFRGPPSDLPLVYKHMSFTSSTLLFSAGGSCYRRRHFTPNGQVVSQKANGIIYRIVRKKNITIWVPFEDFNLMLSAQRRQSQLDGEFHVLLSVLVYFRIQRRGAVQIAHAFVLSSGTSVMICLYHCYCYALWFLLF